MTTALWRAPTHHAACVTPRGVVSANECRSSHGVGAMVEPPVRESTSACGAAQLGYSTYNALDRALPGGAGTEARSACE